ncbi:MAG: apolipoprotein N-acyltransferase, partial [Ferrovum sp.]|nr:apolipoprotein N-acyltransferase [Ferrovum sp.]
AILAILLFAAVLALFPAAVGYLSSRFFAERPKTRWLLAVPAFWTLSEWTRSWFLTGFPWLSLGYAQTPEGPLTGYAPLLGVFGVTATTVLLAGLITTLVTARRDDHAIAPVALGMLLLVGTGVGLRQISWTHALGDPISISLLQGNFPQDQKFQRASTALAVPRYTNLLYNSNSRLVLMPESALPFFRQQMPEAYAEEIERYGYERDSDVLIGMFSEPGRGRYYNSVFSFGHSPSQTYQKVHLVPFGEFIPFEEVLKPLVHAVLSIPLDSQQRGSPDQAPMRVAGQWVAVDICYEDAFGEEIIRALPRATLLANFTNDAWFGNSIGPEQHLQMAQTRALETGRQMLRVTNTGITALIDEKGRIVSRAPRGEIFSLNGMAQGFTGATPFVMMGNAGIVTLCLLALLLSIRLRSWDS